MPACLLKSAGTGVGDGAGVMPWIIPGFLEKMEVVDSKRSYTRVKGVAVSG